MKLPTQETLKRYYDMVTDAVKVKKTSGKPFKSRQKVNTIKDMMKHPTLHVPCFTFIEDESYVECWRCEAA